MEWVRLVQDLVRFGTLNSPIGGNSEKTVFFSTTRSPPDSSSVFWLEEGIENYLISWLIIALLDSHLGRSNDQLGRHFDVQHVPVHCHGNGRLADGGRVLEHSRALSVVFILCRTVDEILTGILDGNVQNWALLRFFRLSRRGTLFLLHFAVLQGRDGD